MRLLDQLPRGGSAHGGSFTERGFASARAKGQAWFAPAGRRGEISAVLGDPSAIARNLRRAAAVQSRSTPGAMRSRSHNLELNLCLVF